MLYQCTCGTGHQALSTGSTGGEIQGAPQSSGDAQFVSPVGKIQGRGTHYFLANPHTPSAKNAFGRVADQGRTGTVYFQGPFLPGNPALPDIQILGQLL